MSGTLPPPAILAIAILAVVAGCLGEPKSDPQESSPELAYPRGVHPYPNGDEWPSDLAGPFKLKSVTKVRVPSFDRLQLEGWIYLPDLPEGVKAPVVLWSLPYLGQTYQTGDDPTIRDNSNAAESVPINLLVENGHAVAAFNVRGTGNSEGCFEMFGRKEQKDQAHLVEWLAAQPWSNGRVGMMGLSYHGTTPWEAAIQNPTALKTIVVAGIVSDLYTFYHSPQGAAFTIGGGFQAAFAGLVSVLPPALGSAQHATVDHAYTLPTRACPEVAKVLTEVEKGHLTDYRDAQFWADRRLISDFPNITASVLLTHGLQDLHGSGHQTQEDAVWQTLVQAPRRMLVGQWEHEFPNFNSHRAEWALKDWNQRALEWLDFWLKGIGDAPPRLGIVDYQDGLGQWLESTAWPPAESHEEVLYFSQGRLSPAPNEARSVFRSVPDPRFPHPYLCPSSSPGATPNGLAFFTEKVEAPVRLAGNPFAYLRITSDQPGGFVGVHVYDLSPNFVCENGTARGARLWSMGVADLRFHQGNFVGRNFPTGTATPVRVDLTNLAEVLEPGHRLAAVVSYGNPADRTGQPWTPNIVILGDGGPQTSHVVLPIQDGTLGGEAPTLNYAPRPFVPRSAE